ncbi:MAG: hypothetical protein CM15mP79_0960 [Methanobacteriota archaeon]|nr:MAG: hypothetical protein CM15mP79_0960 [Euryarchaeota archaeon]
MLSSLDGRNVGVMLDQSTLSVDNLDTRLSTTGIEAEASSLHAMDWLADRHQLGLSLNDASTATVRTFDASGGTGSSGCLGRRRLPVGRQPKHPGANVNPRPLHRNAGHVH